jgi:tetratricopeptide (TPR) repeat protein
VLLTAQGISRRGDPATARKLLLDFEKAIPTAPLRAERGLAVAETWEQESNWPQAIAQYDAWLASFTNHDAQARAEYHRARDSSFESGGGTNALGLFTAFVAHFPRSEFTPRAEMWIADYYFNLGDKQKAERQYKALAQSTNWPPSDLTYKAQLMAGRAAVGRQGWNDAKAYFTSLWNNTNGLPKGPGTDVRYQALFEYGRALMQESNPAETNQLANCEQAIKVFGLICDNYATNRLAVRAWLEKGNCYLQWALTRQQYDALTNALDAYQRVLNSPLSDVDSRSEAKVGLALTLEKWASQKTGKEQTELLKQALNHCLDVVYGNSNVLHDSEQPVALWMNEAGLRAFRLADSLGEWSQEVHLYERLTNSVWPNPPAWMARQAARAQENLSREKAGR